METSHEHTAIHWKFSSLTGSNYFWDIKEYTGREQVLCNSFFFFFYETSFTLIADLVCYATCHIVIVSLTGKKIDVYSNNLTLKPWALLHLLCDLERICNIIVHIQI